MAVKTADETSQPHYSLLEKFSWPDKTKTSEEDALALISAQLNECEAIGSLRDQDGWTLLHHACYKGWSTVVRQLVQEHGADPQCLNNFHSTPLHWAAFGGHFPIVTYLVKELNCNPNCENKRGNTPLQIACWRGNLQVIIFSQ